MKDSTSRTSATFKVGAVSLAFLIVGFQASLFVQKAAVDRIVAARDVPDTVFVYMAADTVYREERHDAPHPPESDRIYRKSLERRCESFPFDPNTASVEDLMRLGFSGKQAAAIDNYRSKGGRFRRKTDFAKSYVVADSVYARLEPFIIIPRTDINKADSAQFDALPGIGPYFSSRMVSLREELHGYSCTEQLMHIHRFDSLKFDAIRDLVECSDPEPYPFWEADETELREHPYVRNAAVAHGIVLFRNNNPTGSWTLENLEKAGVIDGETYRRLSMCRFKTVALPDTTNQNN